MQNKKLSKTSSSICTNSHTAEQNPKLAYKPFGSQVQKASVALVTETDMEDITFAQQSIEATGLELQAKYGKITPESQERLTVLQAKMDGLLNSRLEHTTRFGHNFANIPLRRPDIPIQAKLTIGEPGDQYEQEADETARQVVQSIHQPQSDKLQREELPDEEELQMKPEGNIQRESLSDQEDELQRSPIVQRVSDGGMAATQDLEASINQARGGGQPLANNIREPMEQAFGADFSRVKVHTDTQADQLNQSIQAKAFTTGQDVFFRQGAYEPGSGGGQELLAHELTHVVQQTELIQRQLTNMPVVKHLGNEHRIHRAVYKEGGKGAVTIPAEARSIYTWVTTKTSIQPGGSNHIVNVHARGLSGFKKGGQEYVGGRVFNNNAMPDGNKLPYASGQTYQEWDIHPSQLGVNRGTDRIITSSDGKAYFTNDHYNNFTEFRF
ncbi:DUF4157 domain-containing protein [Nostoc sp. FACHB-133]|uniref:eCIS core domain-containing protein n=1 Tax=Nostoc sp. FACHB-133 TaxID=2692835 RepID=UPI001686736B|nr:DUF4157 domain-containing protein [Nostoc sp. FACHB-133]MBD2524538.1 DUF4157 domain-containing protein [Nostoc sp. FACHB-133]